MTSGLEDLSPFFDDRCWTFVPLAREANVGVTLRRGATEWWRLALWDTEHDRFESGSGFTATRRDARSDGSTGMGAEVVIYNCFNNCFARSKPENWRSASLNSAVCTQRRAPRCSTGKRR